MFFFVVFWGFLRATSELSKYANLLASGWLTVVFFFTGFWGFFISSSRLK